jgi:hypothetical protein
MELLHITFSQHMLITPFVFNEGNIPLEGGGGAPQISREPQKNASGPQQRPTGVKHHCLNKIFQCK